MSIEERSGPELVVQHTGQVFTLGTVDVGIGSQEDNAIILADPSVSPHHVIIFWQADAGAHFIDDLGSHQGTYINGVRIEAPRMLRHGDSIRMGNTVLDLKLPPLPAAAIAGTPPPSDLEGSGDSSKSPI
jgi:pSer/pThr/pTyr-binding forkhead associated (FHA) protein